MAPARGRAAGAAAQNLRYALYLLYRRRIRQNPENQTPWRQTVPEHLLIAPLAAAMPPPSSRASVLNLAGGADRQSVAAAESTVGGKAPPRRGLQTATGRLCWVDCLGPAGHLAAAAPGLPPRRAGRLRLEPRGLSGRGRMLCRGESGTPRCRLAPLLQPFVPSFERPWPRFPPKTRTCSKARR